MVGGFYGQLLLFAQCSTPLLYVEKLHMNDDLESLSMSQSYFSQQRSNISETSSETPSIWQESNLGHFNWPRSTCGGSWKGNLLVAHVDELQESDVHLRRMKTKGDLCPKKETISNACLLTVPRSWQEKVLESEHPNLARYR